MFVYNGVEYMYDEASKEYVVTGKDFSFRTKDYTMVKEFIDNRSATETQVTEGTLLNG